MRKSKRVNNTVSMGRHSGLKETQNTSIYNKRKTSVLNNEALIAELKSVVEDIGSGESDHCHDEIEDIKSPSDVVVAAATALKKTDNELNLDVMISPVGVESSLWLKEMSNGKLSDQQIIGITADYSIQTVKELLIAFENRNDWMSVCDEVKVARPLAFLLFGHLANKRIAANTSNPSHDVQVLVPAVKVENAPAPVSDKVASDSITTICEIEIRKFSNAFFSNACSGLSSTVERINLFESEKMTTESISNSIMNECGVMTKYKDKYGFEPNIIQKLVSKTVSTWRKNLKQSLKKKIGKSNPT